MQWLFLVQYGTPAVTCCSTRVAVGISTLLNARADQDSCERLVTVATLLIMIRRKFEGLFSIFRIQMVLIESSKSFLQNNGLGSFYLTTALRLLKTSFGLEEAMLGCISTAPFGSSSSDSYTANRPLRSDCRHSRYMVHDPSLDIHRGCTRYPHGNFHCNRSNYCRRTAFSLAKKNLTRHSSGPPPTAAELKRWAWTIVYRTIMHKDFGHGCP